MNPDSVVGAVEQNCVLKISYKVIGQSVADWMAGMTSKILVNDKMQNNVVNAGGAEITTLKNQNRRTERYEIDDNMFKNLPNRVGVIFGFERPKIVHICPIPAEKKPLEVFLAPVQKSDAENDATYDFSSLIKEESGADF